MIYESEYCALCKRLAAVTLMEWQLHFSSNLLLAGMPNVELAVWRRKVLTCRLVINLWEPLDLSQYIAAG